MNKKILIGWSIGCIQPETGECSFITSTNTLSSKSEVIKFSGKSNEARIFKNFTLVLENYRKILKKNLPQVKKILK